MVTDGDYFLRENQQQNSHSRSKKNHSIEQKQQSVRCCGT